MNKSNIFNRLDLDIICGENKFYTFKEAATIINKKGLGQNNLFKLLREKGILDKWNHPTEEFEQKSFFKIIENKHLTPLISSYGINYVIKYLL
jgi:phage antirepressor YoqD-like protein